MAYIVLALLILQVFLALPSCSFVERFRRDQNIAPANQYVIKDSERVFTDSDGNQLVENVEVKIKGNRKRAVSKRDVGRELVDCNTVKPPDNGWKTCSNYRWGTVCFAECIENFKFSDGSYKIHYNCTSTGNAWNKIPRIPNCQPTRNDLGCNIDFGKNQHGACVTGARSMKCQGICLASHRYPNGEREIRIECDKSTGTYIPAIKVTPDCKSTGEKEEEINYHFAFVGDKFFKIPE